ncbi:DUF2341 domain-containing protein [Patescibacteria group bacterium]|nr:MAG: DUF2341 domain-containing protein [Patescibacteria group bacterium]
MAMSKKYSLIFSLLAAVMLVTQVLLVSQFSSLVPRASAATSPWTQTNWSGGSGQTSWLDTTKFDSSSNVVSFSAGQLTLATTTAWYDTSLKYRRKITFDNSGQAENLTNFPVLVALNSSRVDYANTQNSGQDIRFTDSDGVTLLPYEIEKWDETSTSTVWVKVPQIASSSSTDHIYVYYGNTTTSSAQSASNVWNNTYMTVQHFSETSGTATIDSTSNGFNGAKTSATEPSPTTSGVIDGGESYDGVDDSVQIAGLSGPKTTFAVDFWLYPLSNKNYNPVITASAGGGWGAFIFHGDSVGAVYAGTDVTTRFAPAELPGGTIALNQWQKFTYTYDGTQGRFYKNGTLRAGPKTQNSPINWLTFTFGATSTLYAIDGKADEFRVSSSTLSTPWIAADYKSEADTYATYAAQEERYASSGTLTSSIFDTEQLSAWGTMTANTDGVATTTLKARTSNSATMVGATAFSSCNAIVSGTDISSNNCVTDGHRYVQYQVTLTSESANTPTFQDVSIAFSAFDTTPPSISLTALSPDPNNDSTPALTGTATEAVGTVSAVQFQMDGTAGSWSACTADDAAFDEAVEPFTCTVAVALSDASHTMNVRATDSNANTTADGAVTTDTFTIDTTAPTVSAVSSSLANGSYTTGQVVPVTITFTEAVTVTGVPQITLETGTPDETVNYSSGSGSTVLTFNYTVVAGDTSTDLDYVATNSLALNGGSIKDAALNNATLTLASPGAAGSLGNAKNIVIDTTAPTVSAVSSTLADGSYATGQVVPVTVTFTEAVTVVGTPQITLETGTPDETVDYASGSGSTVLTFNYTVVAGDTSADLDYVATNSLALNSGTIKDAALNNATLTLASPGAAGSLGNAKALVIDTTAPSTPGQPSASGGSPTTDTTPTWVWSSSTDDGSGLAATPYTVSWCTDVTFASCGANTATASSASYTHATALAGDTWYFRVKATDAVGNVSSYSSNGAVVISSAAPPPGGGGGGASISPPTALTGPSNPPTPPPGGFSVLINNGDAQTANSAVTLTLTGGPDTVRMIVSRFADFHDAGQETYATVRAWNLCADPGASCASGTYTVYAKFYAPSGPASEVVFDTIIHQPVQPVAVSPPPEATPPPQAAPPSSPLPGIIAPLVPRFLKPLLPDFLQPTPPAVAPPEIPIEQVVTPEAPLAFQDIWQLLPARRINEFVLAPLPQDIRTLAMKFPTLEKTFQEVGVSRSSDVEKLRNVSLTLPGLSERVGLPVARLEPGRLAPPVGVPIASLSLQQKKEIPTEIVFAKTGGQLIDFDTALSLSDTGHVEQQISTIAGKPLQFLVKPEQPVSSVKGYVVFKSRNKPVAIKNQELLASIVFATPIFSQPQQQPVRVEEKLVLSEFDYTDPDHDGIYTAEIPAPAVEGEYEIITVLHFTDPALGAKEIRMITVVDPEGYVFEKNGDRETRIPGAIVSLFWLNPDTKKYELWPAKDYQQENPQTTDVRGTYSFLVPPGFYSLTVDAPGYLAHDGVPFEVKEGSGVHTNIELKTKNWILKIVDWRTLLMGVLILLLLYNFYRDAIREKLTRK